MNRTITHQVQGYPTQDGAGVKLVRVLGHGTTAVFDPILMLDSFDSEHYGDYRAGFPMHPHRGIETVSYVVEGKMQHRDSLGGIDTVSDGEVQWMTAGSGILHEERLPESKRLLGVQLWLNLPSQHKMCPPRYFHLSRAAIPEIPFDAGYVRLLAGRYQNHTAFQGRYQPLDYYDVVFCGNGVFRLPVAENDFVMLFTLKGGIEVAGTAVPEKTAVKLENGDTVAFHAQSGSHVLLMKSQALHEPVAWAGPVVMNTREQLEQAFAQLADGTFLQAAAAMEKR